MGRAANVKRARRTAAWLSGASPRGPRDHAPARMLREHEGNGKGTVSARSLRSLEPGKWAAP